APTAADGAARPAPASGAGRRAPLSACGEAGQKARPRQPFELARAWLTCCAALLSAACGWLLPSSTDTIMLPRIWETFGYVGVCGRAWRTLPRLVMKVSTPGRDLFIWARKPGGVSTDRLIGRSPVAREKYFTWAGAVSQSRNFSAAAVRAAPLLKITQLSGPEMVWWPPPVPGNDGMTCTPYCTLGNPDRSHGPVTSMPSLPELNRLA